MCVETLPDIARGRGCGAPVCKGKRGTGTAVSIGGGITNGNRVVGRGVRGVLWVYHRERVLQSVSGRSAMAKGK